MKRIKLSRYLTPVFETPSNSGSWFGYYNYDTLSPDQTRMLSNRTINDARKEIIAFSNAYYNAAQMLIVPASNTAFDACKTVEDVEKILNGYGASVKCGVQTGTTGQYYAKGDEDWGFDGYKFTTIGYDNAALAVQSLINGNIEFVIVDEAPAKIITKSYNG